MAEERELLADWKSYAFHVATEEDLPRIVAFMAKVYVDEPMNAQLVSTLGDDVAGWNPEREYDTTVRVKVLLPHRLSFYVTRKGSQEIVALNMMADSRIPFPAGVLEPRSEVTRITRQLFMQLAEKADLRLPTSEAEGYYASILVTGVHPDFRRQGLALQMYERSLKYLKIKGFSVVKGTFSHVGTQRAAQKCGFDEVARVYLRDQVDEDGTKVFPNAKDEYVVATVKSL